MKEGGGWLVLTDADSVGFLSLLLLPIAPPPNRLSTPHPPCDLPSPRGCASRDCGGGLSLPF